MKWKFDIICVLIGRTNMKRTELTAFSEGDYFILINHSFATEWKRKKLKNSTSFYFLKQVLNNHSDQDH